MKEARLMNKIAKKPRYSRVSDAIELMIWMLETPQGITLKQIQERFNVSRRTAERLRNSLLNALPQVDELNYSQSNEKHWCFINYSIPQLVGNK